MKKPYFYIFLFVLPTFSFDNLYVDGSMDGIGVGYDLKYHNTFFHFGNMINISFHTAPPYTESNLGVYDIIQGIDTGDSSKDSLIIFPSNSDTIVFTRASIFSTSFLPYIGIGIKYKFKNNFIFQPSLDYIQNYNLSFYSTDKTKGIKNYFDYMYSNLRLSFGMLYLKEDFSIGLSLDTDFLYNWKLNTYLRIIPRVILYF